jgi:quercetin dioxygenase-like cupin family protein
MIFARNVPVRGAALILHRTICCLTFSRQTRRSVERKERLMRRASAVALLVTLVFALLASQGMNPSTSAQDATPPSGQQAGPPEGVSFVTLASGTIQILSPGTANLALGRIKFAPGATLPFDPTDPSVDLVFMGSGTLTFRVEAPISVARAGQAGTPVPTEPEDFAAGTEFTMSEGDSALFPPNASGEVRNDGDEDATAWVTNVALFTTEAGTPTP